MKKPKLPKYADLNQLAYAIVQAATDDEPEPEEKSTKNQAAVELGRLGGLKGGTARAKKLTAEQRKGIARIAAAARWKKSED